MDEAFVKALRLRRRSGAAERGTIPFFSIPVERELRNHQYLSPNVYCRAVHLSLLVFKDPQLDQLVGEIVSASFVVRCADTQKDAQPCADFTDHMIGHSDARFADALDKKAHGSTGHVHGRCNFLSNREVRRRQHGHGPG